MKRYSGLPVVSGGLALSAYFIRSVPPQRRRVEQWTA